MNASASTRQEGKGGVSAEDVSMRGAINELTRAAYARDAVSASSAGTA
jgi:hypothetical protein